MTVRQLVAWGVYLRIRNAPPERPWLRDPDDIYSAMIEAYGG